MEKVTLVVSCGINWHVQKFFLISFGHDLFLIKNLRNIFIFNIKYLNFMYKYETVYLIELAIYVYACAQFNYILC